MTTYNVYFEKDDIDGALTCLNTHGYCVVRKMITQELVAELKDSINENLDPDRDLPPSSNRYNMAFAEVSKPLWKLANHAPYMNYVHKVHQTQDICLHRSAAILRTKGEQMGMWHTDHRGIVENPQVPNDVLNRFAMPSGNWFYLNGSHPERSGITVIEDSHLPDWQGPEGFELTPNRTSFRRQGDPSQNGYQKMDVPGCVPVISDPGDLICFAALTYHANMATNERRYSCGISFRPKTVKIDAPWELPESAKKMISELPDHFKGYTDGYTSYDGNWKAET